MRPDFIQSKYSIERTIGENAKNAEQSLTYRYPICLIFHYFVHEHAKCDFATTGGLSTTNLPT